MQREITSNEVKLMQKIQLDILKELDRVCRLENIQYGIDGGTLLGAVRGGGFIPWDPDIDVIMLRDEYEKFYQACFKHLNTDKYFLQEERTDPDYRWGFTKIRRKNTSFVRCGQEHLKMCNGVFIDVLVMDNVPDSFFERKLYEFFCYRCRFVMWSEVGKHCEQNLFKREMYKLANHIPVEYVFKRLRKVRNYWNRKNTKLVRYMTCRYTYNKKLEGIPRKYFEKYQKYKFEDFEFPGFYEYDKYLTLLYGHYMTLPPMEKRVSHMPVSELELLSESEI